MLLLTPAPSLWFTEYLFAKFRVSQLEFWNCVSIVDSKHPFWLTSGFKMPFAFIEIHNPSEESNKEEDFAKGEVICFRFFFYICT